MSREIQLEMALAEAEANLRILIMAQKGDAKALALLISDQRETVKYLRGLIHKVNSGRIDETESGNQEGSLPS